MARQAVNEPRVAVIIPARDEAATIAACLRSLEHQTYRNVETIVVDDGSRDETAQIVARHPDVTLLHGGGNGPSRARNLALRATTAELVAFTDADCICAPTWLEQLVAVLAQGSFAGVGGDQVCPDDASPFGRRVHRFLKRVGFVGDYVRTTSTVSPTAHNPSCNAAYRRQVVLEVGGFDEALWPGEDVDLDRRIVQAGHRLAYTPHAKVAHYRPDDLRAFGRMMRAYGRAQAYLVLKHGPFRPLHAVPMLFVGGLLLSPVLALPPALPLTVAGAALLPWLLLRQRGASAADAARDLPLLHVTVLAWNVGFFEQLRKGRGSCRG